LCVLFIIQQQIDKYLDVPNRMEEKKFNNPNPI
jgi:hypothetical protein